MAWLPQQIASELAAVADLDAALNKRVDRVLQNCPPEIKLQIEATVLGSETGYAQAAALLSDLIFEKAEAA
jgi:hypothetical protein